MNLKRREKIGGAGLGSRALAKMLPLSIIGGGLPALLIVLSCILFLTSALKPAWVEPVRMAAVDAVSPVIEVVNMPLQTAALFVRDVSGLAAMQSENMRLKEENTRLREWHQTALLLEAENKSLRELLNVKVDPQHQFISARILSDTGRTFAKSMLVGAGSRDGVQKGQAVLSAGGVVGRVIEVGETASRVLLITDMNSRVPVLVENSRLHAIFSGTNSAHGRLLHLPPGTRLESGTRIMTSARGGVFPFGLPIGVVKISDNGEYIIEPYADFMRMIHVRILDKPADPYLRQGALN